MNLGSWALGAGRSRRHVLCYYWLVMRAPGMKASRLHMWGDSRVSAMDAGDPCVSGEVGAGQHGHGQVMFGGGDHATVS